MILENINKQIREALEKLGIDQTDFVVETTKDLGNGDYASNVALVLARGNKIPAVEPLGKSAKEIAEKIREALPLDASGYIERVEVAGPGFLNFFVSDSYLLEVQKEILDEKSKFGFGHARDGQKVMVEYTDPNIMKPFHVGHLMSNTIGESFARLYEASGATVARANYFSDVGLAIAKAVWGMREMRMTMPSEVAPIVERTDFLGKAYAFGVKQADESPELLRDIKEINKQIYNKSEGEVLLLYQIGRRWSMEHFEILYRKLGTIFDYLIPESEVVESGMDACRRALAEKLFVESDGAIVFKAEAYGLHTRVFITKEGLPTYEAKDLGLCVRKNALFPYDLSVSVTAYEQDEYFRVVFKAADLLYPNLAGKLKHVSHGMLRLSSGKMSSRTGNVITGESLIADVERKVAEKNPDSSVTSAVAIGAIKYEILKQAPGRDIIFDMEKSLSLEGDSGPYLQYAYARAKSVIARAEFKIQNSKVKITGQNEKLLMRVIARWPDILASAVKDLAPQQICTYLIQLAGEFNSYYASNQIIDENDRQTTKMRLLLTATIAQVVENGLWVLGISAPQRM